VTLTGAVAPVKTNFLYLVGHHNANDLRRDWPSSFTVSNNIPESANRLDPLAFSFTTWCVTIMKRSDEYKHLARVALERARYEHDTTIKTSWETLAESYFRLAEQSEEKISAKGNGVAESESGHSTRL